jgi:hypothetical protein
MTFLAYEYFLLPLSILFTVTMEIMIFGVINGLGYDEMHKI